MADKKSPKDYDRWSGITPVKVTKTPTKSTKKTVKKGK